MRTAALLVTVVAGAIGAAPAAASDDVIVKLDPAERADVHARADVDPAGRVPGLTGVEVVRPEDGDRARALAELRADPAVAWAEPDRPRHVFADSWVSVQWGLENIGQPIDDINGPVVMGTPDADIDVEDAWDSSLGAGITIGVVDTGITYPHPDLQGQIVGNPRERGGGRETNGVDDDGNGLVDDWRGWDFRANDNAAVDANGHGTHVAGIAAAARGGGEVVGVAPGARLLPVQALDVNGRGSTSGVVKSLMYAARQGARIVNVSLGDDAPDAFSQAEHDAIAANPGTLFVVAAGNKGRDAGGDDDIGYFPTYPCDYDLPNIVCVGASDQFDAPASFSNFGAEAVDLFAPGVDIVSTYLLSGSFWQQQEGGPLGYEMLDGTSMATPYVAGAAALVASVHPTWSPTWVKRALLETAEEKPELIGRAVTDGRLDAQDAVAWTPPPGAVDPGPPPGPTPEPEPEPKPKPPPGPSGTPQPQPAPPPAPQPDPEPVVRPAISGLRVVGRPRACRSCGAGSAALSFRASVAGHVRLTAYRRAAGRYKRVGARTVTVRAGKQRIRLGRRLAGAQLKSGRWRVTLGSARVTFQVR